MTAMSGGSVGVLFVCTANVCRSPLAAGLMAFHARNEGAPVQVSSASVDYEVRDLHPLTLGRLADRGIYLDRTDSQPISEKLVSGADLVLVMTAEHARSVVGRFPDELHKVFVLQHFTATVPLPTRNQELGEWLAEAWATPKNYASDVSWDLEDPSMQPTTVFDAIEVRLDTLTRWLATGLATAGRSIR